MTLQEILCNEELRQHEFPISKEKIYLAHAGVCPLPRRVVEAMNSYNNACLTSEQDTAMPAGLIPKTRSLAATLLGVTPEEISLVGPTSLALSFIAGSIRLKRGHHALIYFDDYPSNVYPWMALADRGIEVRFLNIRKLGQIRPRDILGQIDENTGLVALASAHFLTGYRLEIESIAATLREKKILFCVDAIQTLGAFPVPGRLMDFAAADSHKWMLGPCAAGIMFVRRDLQEKLRPTTQGWHNIENPDYISQEEMVFHKDGRRFEPGTANFIGLVGMRAAMEILLEVGIDNIAAELWRKRSWIVPALQAMGAEVWHADAPESAAAGSITFHIPGRDMAAIHRALLEKNIITSLRSDRSGVAYLRLSPHFYNTDAELHRTLEAVRTS